MAVQFPAAILTLPAACKIVNAVESDPPDAIVTINALPAVLQIVMLLTVTDDVVPKSNVDNGDDEYQGLGTLKLAMADVADMPASFTMARSLSLSLESAT